MIDEPNGSKTHKYSELPRIKSERSMPVRVLISVIKDAQKEAVAPQIFDHMRRVYTEERGADNAPDEQRSKIMTASGRRHDGDQIAETGASSSSSSK